MASRPYEGESWRTSRRGSADMSLPEKRFHLPCDFPYAHVVVTSTETESDEEEEHMVGLTQRIARSTLDDKHNSSLNLKVDSPQSTLCSSAGRSVRIFDSSSNGSRGSSNGPSQASSPRLRLWNRDALDLLHAATGRLVLTRSHGEKGAFQKWPLLGVANTPVPIPVAETKSDSIPSHCLHRRWSQNRDSAALKAHFEYLKQQQKLRSWNLPARTIDAHLANCTLPTDSCSRVVRTGGDGAQKPSVNNGTRAVLLTNSGSKECAGTGVFLPRTGNIQTGFRKRSGCSTVLLPARVVQALNLNVDVGSAQWPQPSYYQGILIPGRDIRLQPQPHARNSDPSSQTMFLRPQQQPIICNELRLPQEWTY